MLHKKATENAEDHAAAIKTKIGLWMFLLYTLVYAGFIFITVTFPGIMETNIGHLNLAIVYGIGLIVFALILALIYNHVCSKHEENLNGKNETSGEVNK